MSSIILFTILIFIILIGYILFFQAWLPSLPKQLQESDFFYYGHRGAPDIAPENTLLSFQKSIDCNIDGLELDVQLSQDEKMIIYHDQFIDYNNQKIDIQKLKMKDIQRIDVNNKFDNLEPQFIPTLEQVIDMLPDNIILNIEVKSYAWKSSKKITKKILDLTTKKGINNQIIISSFDPFIIKRIKKMNPSISTAFIWWSSESYYHYKFFTYYAKPDVFHVNINDVTSNMVNWFNKKNINIYAYTVNNKIDLDKAKRYGLNGIFTDNPKMKNV